MNIKENVALIDKVIFGGITIVDIENMDELVTRGVIEQGKTNTPYYTESWQQFSRLTIEHDGVIDKTDADEYAFNKVIRDAEQGFQGWEMKFNSVASSRGDYPFTAISFGLATDRFGSMLSSVCMKVSS